MESVNFAYKNWNLITVEMPLTAFFDTGLDYLMNQINIVRNAVIGHRWL